MDSDFIELLNEREKEINDYIRIEIELLKYKYNTLVEYSMHVRKNVPYPLPKIEKEKSIFINKIH